MSGVHKYPTISFRISPREREEIEAKILASGLSKKDYFVRSCIYNRVCVVGKKELVYQLVEELKIMQTNIREVTEQFEKTEIELTPEGLEGEMRLEVLKQTENSIMEAGHFNMEIGECGYKSRLNLFSLCVVFTWC